MNGYRIIIILFTGIATVPLHSQAIPIPYFIPPNIETSETGYIQLKWVANSDTIAPTIYHYQLQQAADSLFSQTREIYSGSDLASFISGLPNGKFYYRVRIFDDEYNRLGPWSNCKQVLVKHHSLKLALTLFTLGGIVFLSTVVIVIRGSRKIRNED